MALPNSFQPTIPEPDTPPITTGAQTTGPVALPIQGRTPDKPFERPVASVGSDSGKDKFKVMLQKKLASLGLTDGTTLPVDDATEEVADTATSTTSPFDLAAEARVQTGKGKLFFFSDVTGQLPTTELPTTDLTTEQLPITQLPIDLSTGMPITQLPIDPSTGMPIIKKQPTVDATTLIQVGEDQIAGDQVVNTQLTPQTSITQGTELPKAPHKTGGWKGKVTSQPGTWTAQTAVNATTTRATSMKDTTAFVDADADATTLIGEGEETAQASLPTTLTGVKPAIGTPLQGAITSFELDEENEVLEAEATTQEDAQAATTVMAPTSNKQATNTASTAATSATVNPLMPTAGSIASADDIKNLQLFTREDILKAFASWENKKKSDMSSLGLAIGATTVDPSQVQAQVTGVTQIDAPTQKTGTDELAKARDAREITIQLIDKLVGALNQLSQTDRTETTLTLKYPPIFEGVSITITEFKTAQKEFNITFFNLTNPTARLLIETKQNQDNLRNALIEKGYMLQMITIEPKIDISTSTSTTSDGKRQGQQGRGFDQGGQPQGGFGGAPTG